MRKRFNDTWGQGHSHHFHGIALCAAARYGESLNELASAIEHLERTGDQWELNLAHYHTAVSEYRLGHLSAARNEAQRTFDIGVAIGDDQLPHFCIDLWAKATNGQFPFRELQGRFRSIQEDAQSTSQLLQAEALWHLHHQRFEEAVAVLHKAVAIPKRAGVFNLHTMPALPWLATAIRKLAARIREDDPAASRRLLNEGLRIARRAIRRSKWFVPDRPHAFREYGLLLAERQRWKPAMQALENSVAIALSHRSSYEAALSRLATAQVAIRLSHPEAEEQFTMAKSELSTFGNSGGNFI
jgi:two-component system sensor kinase